MQNERETFLDDVVTTAVESEQVNDWATIQSYKWRRVRVHATLTADDTDNPITHRVDAKVIAAGFDALRDPQVDVNPAMRGSMLAAEVECDAGAIDANDADVLVQLGLFGQIVYA